MGPLGDKDQEALATYKMAKRRAGQKRGHGFPNVSGDKVQGGRYTLIGFNRRAGWRNRCYRRHSEYHLAPRCTWRDSSVRDRSPPFQERSEARRPSCSASSMEPRFRPRRRRIWTARRPRVYVNNHFRPRWMWGVCSWPRMRIAWWCWIRGPRPIWYALVGLRAIIALSANRTLSVRRWPS